MHFSVVSCWDEDGISRDWTVVCKCKTPDKLWMCINLEQGLSFRNAPHYNLAICTSRYHFSQVVSILGQNGDTVGVIVQSLEEWLGKHLFQLYGVQSSFVLSGFLKGVHCGIRGISVHFLDFTVGLFFVFFFISADCLYFYHFWCVFKIKYINLFIENEI